MLGPWELVADDGTVMPVVVPGTVAQAHRGDDLDERTWVFRSTVLEVPADPVLVVGGVATSYEVIVDGTVLVSCRSMYTGHRLPVDVRAGSVVEIRCLPLATAMPDAKPPRARWRTRIVDDNSLRLVRTTLLGRCPGIAPGPPVVGPWR
ncbi:MAG: beta-mannosidase, partial [Frankiales bacterium]|nr:beta-mannosidase [Frankiales bacterium]